MTLSFYDIPAPTAKLGKRYTLRFAPLHTSHAAYGMRTDIEITIWEKDGLAVGKNRSQTAWTVYHTATGQEVAPNIHLMKRRSAVALRNRLLQELETDWTAADPQTTRAEYTLFEQIKTEVEDEDRGAGRFSFLAGAAQVMPKRKPTEGVQPMQPSARVIRTLNRHDPSIAQYARTLGIPVAEAETRIIAQQHAPH